MSTKLVYWFGIRINNFVLLHSIAKHSIANLEKGFACRLNYLLFHAIIPGNTLELSFGTPPQVARSGIPGNYIKDQRLTIILNLISYLPLSTLTSMLLLAYDQDRVNGN